MRAADWLLGAILVVLGIAIIIEAQSFPDPRGQLYGGGFFPTIVGAGFVTVGALLSVRGIVNRDRTLHLGGWVRDPIIVFRLFLLVVCTMAAIMLIRPLGFLLTGLLFVGVFMLGLGVRPVPAALITVAAVLGVWFVFGRLLHVALPYGVLERLLF